MGGRRVKLHQMTMAATVGSGRSTDLLSKTLAAAAAVSIIPATAEW